MFHESDNRKINCVRASRSILPVIFVLVQLGEPLLEQQIDHFVCQLESQSRFIACKSAVI
jgi:hypothetical protein